jgi:hypothetical protein
MTKLSTDITTNTATKAIQSFLFINFLSNELVKYVIKMTHNDTKGFFQCKAGALKANEISIKTYFYSIPFAFLPTNYYTR